MVGLIIAEGGRINWNITGVSNEFIKTIFLIKNDDEIKAPPKISWLVVFNLEAGIGL